MSIVSVLAIHITTKTLELGKYDLNHFPLTLYFNQSLRFAVPIFFMISAYVSELNFSSKFSYFTYLKKRFTKLFFPYLFWSSLYYFWIYPHNSKSFLLCLFTGDSSYQLYFIPSLFIFYLIFPLIHRFLNFFSRKGTLLLLTLAQIVILSLDYYYHPLNLPYPISVFLLNFEFFIIGVLSSHCQQKILAFVKKHFKLLTLFFILLSLFITFEAKFLYYKSNSYLSFYSQWRPSIFVYSLISAALFYYLFNQLKSVLVVTKIASFSLFVYFVHIIFIEQILKLFPATIFVIPILPFLITLCLSYFGAFISSKIPYLSKLTA